MALVLIRPTPEPEVAQARVDDVLRCALAGRNFRTVARVQDLTNLTGNTLLFVLSLGETGVNLEYTRMLSRLRREPGLLDGCTAGLLVDGVSPLYTKSAATELVLAANLAGCTFLGRPLVEGTGDLSTFRIQAQVQGISCIEAYRRAAQDLIVRLEGPPFPRRAQPKLVVLHASSHHTSNTMALWDQVRQRLGNGVTCQEIGLRNGTLSDCSGCPYTMCLHFGERGGCFYGGVMQEEVYPAVRSADALVMLCPNYNDALSANLTACINRLTALFRQTRFYDKALFAIVVSGYSGGDIVARQLIAALNMNKSFHLPSHFALLETANDPGQALALPGIQERLDVFASHIAQVMGANTK
ncbi:MAG: flavodoxin family protein [Lawsonibacter sp.]|jgi:multimeric flavodoxin WrbA